MKLRLVGSAALATVTILSTLVGCSDPTPPNNASGGSTAKGGAGPASGGTTAVGAGGSNSGGIAGSSGGASSGGASSGGASSGGISSAGGTSGGSASGGGSAIPATFATVAAVIKDRTAPHNCFGGACHDSEQPWFHLLGPDHELLSDDALYTFMKGYNTKNCGALINVANPAQSAIVRLLKGACGATPVMPWDKCYEENGVLGGDCVPTEKVNAIEQWIAAGAPR